MTGAGRGWRADGVPVLPGSGCSTAGPGTGGHTTTGAGTLVTWWLTLATLIGRFLSSVFVLSFTRLTRGTG